MPEDQINTPDQNPGSVEQQNPFPNSILQLTGQDAEQAREALRQQLEAENQQRQLRETIIENTLEDLQNRYEQSSVSNSESHERLNFAMEKIEEVMDGLVENLDDPEKFENAFSEAQRVVESVIAIEEIRDKVMYRKSDILAQMMMNPETPLGRLFLAMPSTFQQNIEMHIEQGDLATVLEAELKNYRLTRKFSVDDIIVISKLDEEELMRENSQIISSVADIATFVPVIGAFITLGLRNRNAIEIKSTFENAVEDTGIDSSIFVSFIGENIGTVEARRRKIISEHTNDLNRNNPNDLRVIQYIEVADRIIESKPTIENTFYRLADENEEWTNQEKESIKQTFDVRSVAAIAGIMCQWGCDFENANWIDVISDHMAVIHRSVYTLIPNTSNFRNRRRALARAKRAYRSMKMTGSRLFGGEDPFRKALQRIDELKLTDSTPSNLQKELKTILEDNTLKVVTDSEIDKNDRKKGRGVIASSDEIADAQTKATRFRKVVTNWNKVTGQAMGELLKQEKQLRKIFDQIRAGNIASANDPLFQKYMQELNLNQHDLYNPKKLDEIAGLHINKISELQETIAEANSRINTKGIEIDNGLRRTTGRLEQLEEDVFKETRRKHQDVANMHKFRNRRIVKYGSMATLAVGPDVYRFITGDSSFKQAVKSVAQVGLEILPGIGTYIAFKNAFQGTDGTGKELNLKQRVLQFGFAGLSLLSDVALVLGGPIGAAAKAALVSARYGTRAANGIKNAPYLFKAASKVGELFSGLFGSSKLARAAKYEEKFVEVTEGSQKIIKTKRLASFNNTTENLNSRIGALIKQRDDLKTIIENGSGIMAKARIKSAAKLIEIAGANLRKKIRILPGIFLTGNNFIVKQIGNKFYKLGEIGSLAQGANKSTKVFRDVMRREELVTEVRRLKQARKLADAGKARKKIKKQIDAAESELQSLRKSLDKNGTTERLQQITDALRAVNGGLISEWALGATSSKVLNGINKITTYGGVAMFGSIGLQMLTSDEGLDMQKAVEAPIRIPQTAARIAAPAWNYINQSPEEMYETDFMFTMNRVLDQTRRNYAYEHASNDSLLNQLGSPGAIIEAERRGLAVAAESTMSDAAVGFQEQYLA